jgi:hypothetical protein
MRINGTLHYILNDHPSTVPHQHRLRSGRRLGSASVVSDASGNTLGGKDIIVFGETRFTTMITDKMCDSSGIG